ncbi:hypothetical protein EV421DRAFT_2040692 [Armillaria borealis]|uniref:Uncharacterized protein n=1 Tax=Armillaria borealis TaxID=47425 RepID=A0AA39J0D2_9AGAR|nr:hypothetical protein EV421DRAFT_2040692 [Armillaria borealis]
MAVVSHPLLSEKSKLYERDTFIFSTSLPAKLLFGSDTYQQRHGAALGIPLSTAQRAFHLHPVTVHQFGIMAYAIMPNGPPIPESSPKQLPPGNYGWYDSDSTARFLPQITTTPNPPSFAAMQKTWTIHPNPGIMLDVIPSVAQAVRRRDQYRCFVTGTASHNDTDLVWMFPPCFARLCRFPPLRNDYHPIPQFFETASNAAFLHKDLIPFFHENAFSVDVDDDYRVLIFRDIGPAEKLLPSHLRVSPNEGPEDWFLREHFRISLKVCILEGDIDEDYPSSVVLRIMDDLWVNSVGSDDTVELAPMTDPRWQTVIGKSIWENVLETRMAANYVPPDDYDEEEADLIDK